jgi:hypothetical protein
MAQVQITDVVLPAEFTAYQVENSMLSTALFQSGVVLPNGEMSAQLNAGAGYPKPRNSLSHFPLPRYSLRPGPLGPG